MGTTLSAAFLSSSRGEHDKPHTQAHRAQLRATSRHHKPGLAITSLTTTMDAFPALTPAQWCQVFFGLSTAAVLAIQVVPKTTQRLLLDYGARSPANTTGDKTKEAAGPKELDLFTKAAKAVTSFGQIPHSWFMHFYVASVAGSTFWAWQYLQSGSAMTFIAARQAASGGPSMSIEQTGLVWTLMALQGTRRLYECLFVMRPGSSKMWFVHWLLGLGFYLCMSVSVWVDGSDSQTEVGEPAVAYGHHWGRRVPLRLDPSA
ncbi:3-oxo-5-alpha-steroid 4-dehydrogenase [Colletotrichum orchidophilum]|uniref:Polyprenal reductase n=1 Tax=Colletotrichum orchidophilum TaxID=1209926 RepID=A0A1G4BMI3_9PEZI|nr:3-oxo-5-alpha-steroid 4-dehydrogenase [Colletotrichum orchidophilum]OHF02672.1 3-oxo-5-alpha-steroid 4-dehydrogenase [Colletotrichum orchidophilum]